MKSYDFTNSRPNPYAEKMKNGYSVAIHYENPKDINNNDTLNKVIDLLKQPGLNSVHLYVNKDNNYMNT